MLLTTFSVFLILLGNYQTHGKGIDMTKAVSEAPDQHSKSGGMNDGRWYCPGKIYDWGCAYGELQCSCPGNGAQATYRISCCMDWLVCGEPCSWGHNCYKYRNCQTCRAVAQNGEPPCYSCRPGWLMQGGYCNRVDPCYANNGGCEHTCTVTATYQCSCNPGYRLKRDQHTCLYLTCPAPGQITNGTVTSTDNWKLNTFAKFKCDDAHSILDGPYATKCMDNVVEEKLHWSDGNPSCKNSCDEVEENRRNTCPGNGDASEVKCLQLGCCYKTALDSSVPSCYMDPYRFFFRFDGHKPETYTPDVTLHERHMDACALQTVKTYHHTIFVIIEQGMAPGTQDLVLQTCEPLPGKMNNYTMESDPNAYTFQSMDTLTQVVTVSEGDRQLEVPYEAVTAIPSAIFTQYPKMRSLVSPRLVVRLSSDVKTPVDNPTCVGNCYKKCDVLTLVSTSDGVVTVHSMHVNLADVKNYVTMSTRRLVLSVHTVVINSDVHLPVPVVIQAEEMIVDVRHASFINLPRDGVLGDTHQTQESSAKRDSMIRQCIEN